MDLQARLLQRIAMLEQERDLIQKAALEQIAFINHALHELEALLATPPATHP